MKCSRVKLTLIATTTREPEANTVIGLELGLFDDDEMEIPNPAELLIQELLESNDHVHFTTHAPWD